ncbi:MAG: AbrB/MazE/SpoVT family DNA-binding domain-containing protein [Chloroflexi bacterium]|nr:AbrB/MazE/SpoVT family DNA-binding domain-containing protein [Chloroflexota bacterium]
MCPSQFSVKEYLLTLGARGRVVLPAPVRERLELREGDRLVLIVQPDGTMRLASLRHQAEHVQGLYAHLAPGVDLAGELIQERREEANRE